MILFIQHYCVAEVEHFPYINQTTKTTHGVGIMTAISCRKKLKIRNDTIFGQVHLDYKWLDLNEFKPKLNSKSLSLNHYTLLHLWKVAQTHTFSQDTVGSKVTSRFKYHLAKWSIALSSECSSFIIPSEHYFLLFSLFKVCHSPLRWQAEGWWWDRVLQSSLTGAAARSGREGAPRGCTWETVAPAVSAYVEVIGTPAHACRSDHRCLQEGQSNSGRG